MTEPGVAWLTFFIDRPSGFDEVVAFWERVTGTRRSAPRGAEGEFATLVPPAGDAHVRVQRVRDGRGGTHLDLHADDPASLAERAIALGAALVTETPVAVLASPGCMVFCVVGWHGETRMMPPLEESGGAASRLDQVCLDIPPATFDAEVAFWSALLDRPAVASSLRPEFASIDLLPTQPVRLLLQRLDEGEGAVTAHLDLAAGERVADVVAAHVEAGATVEGTHEYWTVLTDPTGHHYCVTHRDPARA